MSSATYKAFLANNFFILKNAADKTMYVKENESSYLINMSPIALLLVMFFLLLLQNYQVWLSGDIS